MVTGILSIELGTNIDFGTNMELSTWWVASCYMIIHRHGTCSHRASTLARPTESNDTGAMAACLATFYGETYNTFVFG